VTRTLDSIGIGDGSIRILRLKEVQAMIGGIDRKQIDRLEAAGDFPRRIHITRAGLSRGEMCCFVSARERRVRPCLEALQSSKRPWAGVPALPRRLDLETASASRSPQSYNGR
jgi:predicted DNA-binding transcriptional regulator AlpA